MALRTLIPAASSAFVALETVKRRLNISGSDQDEVLRGVILGVSAAMEERVGFPLGRAQFEERFRGERTEKLWLSMFPVAPETLTVTVNGIELEQDDFALEPETGELFRRRRWPVPFANCLNSDPHNSANVVARYCGLYLLPDQVDAWKASTPIARGSYARASFPSTLRFECTVPGTTGDTEPAWPESAGSTVLDGDVTWAARTAWELSAAWQEHAYVATMGRFRMLDVPSAIASVIVDGAVVHMFANQAGQTLNSSALEFIDRWRQARGARFS